MENSELIQCPKCRKEIVKKVSSFSCSHCQIDFPTLHGIPWVFRFPEATLLQWQARTKKLLQKIEMQILNLEAEGRKVNLLSKTQKRLAQLNAAYVENKNFLESYLADLWPPNEAQRLLDISLVLSEKVGAEQTIESYFNNVFRDWSWDNGENETNLKTVMSVVPQGFHPQRMVVLGAGSGRLVADLHAEMNSGYTLAVDINPFLLFLFKDLNEGQTFELWEIPIGPFHLDSVAKKQILKSPNPQLKNLEFIFADGMNLPLKPKIVDCILTPWFVDIVKQDFRDLVRRINRHLVSGGHWINFGPLGFAHRSTSENYCLEEVEQILADEGFQIKAKNMSRIPYLSSPLSGFGRTELVLTFLATKIKDVKEPAYFSPLPHWLLDTGQPILPEQDIQPNRSKHQVAFQILSLIDGKNSVNTISEILAKHYSIAIASAREAVIGFLVEMFER